MKTKPDVPAEEKKPIPMLVSDVAVWDDDERLGRYGSPWPMTGRTPEEVREAAKALPAPVRDTDAPQNDERPPKEPSSDSPMKSD